MFWRYFGLGFSAIVCILLGGIASEFIQAMLPYKTFQWGDAIVSLFYDLLIIPNIPQGECPRSLRRTHRLLPP